METHDYVTLSISILALIVSIGVLILHYRRDKRECEKQKQDEKNNKKCFKFFASKATYELERGLDPKIGDYFEDHIVDFTFSFRNIGVPSIYPTNAILTFLKPLLGEEIRSFHYSLNPSKSKINQGEEFSLRFGQGFESFEIADSIIKSTLKIKLIDIEGNVFESQLIKLKIGIRE